MNYIRDGAEQIFGDADLFEEPVTNKFYWSISKFIQIQGRLYEQYRMLLSLTGNIIGVEGNVVEFERLRHTAYLNVLNVFRRSKNLFWIT